ncbi:S22A5 protein, partial [Polypterus senegalus]
MKVDGPFYVLPDELQVIPDTPSLATPQRGGSAGCSPGSPPGVLLNLSPALPGVAEVLRFGRKKTLFITLAMQTVCSLIQVASVNWLMFCILFFFVGFAQNSKYISAFVLGNELLVKSIRITYSTLGVCVFYALGYAVLPMFAYFIRDWRMLLLVLSLPGVLYTPLWWLIPESPRWLLSQGQMEEAKAILHAAAQKNGVTPPEVIFTPDESLELMGYGGQSLCWKFGVQRKKQPSTEHQFPSRPIYAYMGQFKIASPRNLLANTIGYFGISLNTSNMNGDPYITCFISAATEIAAYTIAWAILKHAPRRCVLSLLLLLSGSLLLFIQCVPSELPVLTIILAMIGKFGLTISMSIIYVYSSELFPTVVRNMGMGAASMFTGIGGVTAPYFAYFGSLEEQGTEKRTSHSLRHEGTDTLGCNRGHGHGILELKPVGVSGHHRGCLDNSRAVVCSTFATPRSAARRGAEFQCSTSTTPGSAAGNLIEEHLEYFGCGIKEAASLHSGSWSRVEEDGACERGVEVAEEK